MAQHQPYQPQPYQPQTQPYQPQPPPRGKMTTRHKAVFAIVLSIAALLVLGIAAGIAQSAKSQTSSHLKAAGTPGVAAQANPGTTPAQGARTAKPVAKPKPGVLATFSGTGIENTGRFTVGGTWKLDWRYDCSAFGSSGNFIVNEDASPAGAVQVNELGHEGHGATFGYSDAGTHFLSVDSECSWSVKVVGTR